MLRSGNTTTILCEEQSKFILDRISSVEKHFSELCGAFSEYTRKVARVRDRSDELAHVAQDYCDTEKTNRTLANALSSLAKALTLIGDFHDARVKRLETKIVAELSQYESVCKHCKEGVKEALVVRDKDLTRRKQLEQSKNRQGRMRRHTNDTEIIKSNLEVEKSLKEIERLVERFEKQKLHDMKELLQSFVLIELKMHTQAMEVLSATYQDIADIDETRDQQGIHKELKRQNRQFKKYLQQDSSTDRYFLQRIKSQSMGALNATLAGFSGGRKNKSLSSNSLNSSQEQEQDPDADHQDVPTVEPQRAQRHPVVKRLNKTSALNATLAGFSGGRKNKSLSSNSLNSSQEQEQDPDADHQDVPTVEPQRAQRHPVVKRLNKTSAQQSIDSLSSLKQDISSESNTSSDDDDTEDSETLTDEDLNAPAKPTKIAAVGEPSKKLDSKYKIIKLKDYNP